MVLQTVAGAFRDQTLGHSLQIPAWFCVRYFVQVYTAYRVQIVVEILQEPTRNFLRKKKEKEKTYIYERRERRG